MNHAKHHENPSIFQDQHAPLIAPMPSQLLAIGSSAQPQKRLKVRRDKNLVSLLGKMLVLISLLLVLGCDGGKATTAPPPDPMSILTFSSKQDDLASRKVIQKEFVEFNWGGSTWQIPATSVHELNRPPSGETNTISIVAAMQKHANGHAISFGAPSSEDPRSNRFLFATIHYAASRHQGPLEALSEHVRFRTQSGAKFKWQQYPDSPSQIGGELEKPLLYRPVISVTGMSDAFGGDIFWKCTSSTGYRIDEFISGFASPKHWLFNESCRMDVRLTNSLRAAVYVPVGSMHDPENVSRAALEFLSRLLTTKE
jgi:hypothetical protein